jgi:hypothetical protein
MAEYEPVDSTDDVDGGNAAGGDADEPNDPVFTCPSCSEPIVLTEAPANGLVECPACGAQFFAAADPDDIEAEARAEAEAEAALGRREAELSELHVRQISTLRRSMIRSRSYFITGAWACIIAAAELVWLAALRFGELTADKASGIHVGITSYFIPIAEVLCLVPAVLGSRYFFRRARQAAIELKATVMKDPETPPDLSTLGGGLEPWRGLEEMHEGSGDDTVSG